MSRTCGPGTILAMGLLPLLFITAFAFADSPKRTICTATINSSEERKVFQKFLPAKDFDFIELTDFSKETKKELRGSEWLDAACQAGVQCDVLLISGHFGGSFFGETGFSLGMDKLEWHSCQNSCEGILKRPTEVFLLGCNTMAGRTPDGRTPEQYLQVLLQDNIDRTEAERIVEARYGSVGDSFLNQMRRVFAGVPHLYGFDSIGPSGKTIKSFLIDYLKKIPNYAERLNKLEAEKMIDTVDSMNQALAVFNWNKDLAKSLEKTSFYECPGLLPGEAGLSIRSEICTFHNRSIALDKKVEIMGRMLKQEDRLLYLPSIASFIRLNKRDLLTDQAAMEKFRLLGEEAGLRENLPRLEKSLHHSIALKTDLLQLEQMLGWFDEAEFKARTWENLKPDLQQLTRANVDTICSVLEENNLQYEVKLEDLDPKRVREEEGAGLFACVGTKDERIVKIVVNALKEAKPASRTRLLTALWRMQGADEEVLVEARKAMLAKEYEQSMMGKLLVLKRSKDETEKEKILLGAMDQDATGASILVADSKVQSERVARAFAKTYLKPGMDYMAAMGMVRLMPLNSPYWPELLGELAKLGPKERENVRNMLIFVPLGNSVLADWVITEMADPKLTSLSNGDIAQLSGDLSESQMKRMADFVTAYPDALGSQLFRGMIDRQREKLGAEPKYPYGARMNYQCSWNQEQGAYNCRMVN